MEDAHIKDTIIFALSNSLKGVPAVVSAQTLLVAQTVLNVFIPSGSGQAAATMPIMAPLADMLGVSRQVATLAFQFLADYVFKTWEAVTGGIRGRTLPPPEVLGLVLDTPEKLWYLVLLFALPLFFYGKRLLMTRAGRAFRAVRDNDGWEFKRFERAFREVQEILS